MNNGSENLDEAVNLDYREQSLRISKLQQEIKYIQIQRTMYPAVVLSGATLAAVALVNLILSG